MYVPFSVAVETVVVSEMTQSSSHESQSAETHNERRHVTKHCVMRKTFEES